MPPSTPTHTGRPIFVMKTPVITAASVMPVPIDRSMPPVMMTNVVPRARMPITAVESRMPEMLLQVKKLFPKIEKNATSTTSVPKASDCCSWRLRKPPTSRRSVFSLTACWMTVVVDPFCDGVLISLPPRVRRAA